MKVNVFLPFSHNYQTHADMIVGVDYGAYQLAKSKVFMDVAIGDFDSVSKDELKLIKEFSKTIVSLKAEKDETDSEAALIYLKKLGLTNITLIGDVGSRLDHFLINLKLVEKYKVTYVLEHSKIFYLEKGLHQVKKAYKYLSLFTSSNCRLSISGVKYPLENKPIDHLDTFLSSNEIIEDFANIEILEGSLIVVLSNDK